MTVNKKIEALENALINYKYPKKYFVQVADRRIGHKFAIASNTENGGLSVHSNFMTYEEFNAYLRGYYDAKMNKFKN